MVFIPNSQMHRVNAIFSRLFSFILFCYLQNSYPFLWNYVHSIIPGSSFSLLSLLLLQFFLLKNYFIFYMWFCIRLVIYDIVLCTHIFNSCKVISLKHLLLLHWPRKPLTLDHNTLWKILRDGPTRPPYLSPEKPVCRSRRNRTRRGTTDWFKIGKGVCQGYMLSPLYLTCIQSTSCKMPGWMKLKVESSLPGRNINNLR